MAKATSSKAAPRRAKSAAPVATEAAVEREEPKPQYSFGLSQPGEDIPDGARRLSCPNCGAKHDVIRSDNVPGQAGTWSVPDFKCVAGCGYSAPVQPVH